MADSFENSLRIMRVSLLFSGIKTYQSKWNSKLEVFVDKILCYTNLIALYSVIFGEIVWLIHGVQTGRSFTELSLALPLITITLLSTVKSYNLYLHRNIVCEIIDTLKDMHPKENLPKHARKSVFREYYTNENSGDSDDIYEEIDLHDKEIDITNGSVKMLNTVVNLLMSISCSVLIMFCLAPLVAMFFEYQAKGETSVLYPYQVEYWFDIYATRWWPVLYLHQVVATIVVCVNLFGAETLFYAVCTYVEMHFRLLCYRLKNLKRASARQIKEDLVVNVVKHQRLIYLVEQAEKLFSKPALLHIITSSLLICLSAFNITVTDDMKTLFAFLTFLILSLSQVFLICFFGDKLMRSSTEVSGATYDGPWYVFDAPTKKAVLIIIMRSRKPCKFTAANFADLNLMAFTTILSRSWSYFALLKTVYN